MCNKRNFIKSIFVAFISSVLFFTSCQNFLEGERLFNKIESAVDYVNSPSFTIRVVLLDPDSGILTGDSGMIPCKVSDWVNLGFTPKAGYEFLYWEAVNKDEPDLSMSSFVQFEDSTKLETKVKILEKSDTLVIRPYCVCKLSLNKFNDFLPTPTRKSEGVAKDSAIELFLNQKLFIDDEGNNFTNIRITQSGIPFLSEDITEEYFTEPTITNTKEGFGKIVIMPNFEKRLPLTSGTAEITVSILSGTKYLSNNKISETTEDISYHYTISPVTGQKTKLAFITPNEEIGKFRVDGTVPTVGSMNYNLDESFTLSFKVKSGYRFVGWSFAEGDVYDPVGAKGVFDLSYPDYEETNGYNSITETATVVLKILNPSDLNSSITPFCEKDIDFGSLLEPSNKVEGGVSKDSSIVLRLNQKICDDKVNNVNDIKITQTGIMGVSSDVTSYFQAPVIGNVEQDGEEYGVISISADPDKLLNLTGTAIGELTVVIPETFKYVGNSGNIEFGKVLSYTYTINSSTNDKAKILITTSNSDSASITINGETAPEERVSYNLKEELDILFSLSGMYKFIGWKYSTDGVNFSSTVPAAVSVTYPSNSSTEGYDSNTRTAKIKVKVLGAHENLTIKMISESNLSLDRISTKPENKESIGVPRDSGITLVFDHKLVNDENDLGKITITQNGVPGIGSSVRSYFGDISISENDGMGQIVIPPKTGNRIPLTESGALATITVTLPSSLKYYSADNEIISLGSELSYSYTINSETTQRASLSFTQSGNVNEASIRGALQVNGNVFIDSTARDYNLGDIIQIQFKPSEAYRFKGWQFKTGGSNFTTSVPTQYISWDESYDSETKISSATLYVLSSLNTNDGTVGTIEVQAITEKIPTSNIYLKGDSQGRVSPEILGDTRKEGDVLHISSYPNSDQCFTSWDIILVTNDNGDIKRTPLVFTQNNSTKIYENTFMTVTDIYSSETDVYLNSVPYIEKTEGKLFGDIYILPRYATRPSVLSRTPTPGATGVYKDARIQFVFDYPMSSDSIYYHGTSDPELPAAATKVFLKGETSWRYRSDVINDDLIYAYIEDGQKFYKNIKITNFQNGTNLAENYGEPSFDSPETLTISTNKSAHPASQTRILVELSNNFFYEESGAKVSLSKAEKTIFTISSETDNVPPIINNSTLKFSIGNGSNGGPDRKILYVAGGVDKRTTLLVDGQSEPTSTDKAELYFADVSTDYFNSNKNDFDEIRVNFLNNEKIYVYAGISDRIGAEKIAGVGVATAKLKFVPKLDDDYKIVTNRDPIFIEVQIPNDIDVSIGSDDELQEVDVSSLPDGLYEMSLVAIDACNNSSESTNKVPVLLDRTGPKIDFSKSPNNGESLTLKWNPITAPDAASTEINKITVSNSDWSHTYNKIDDSSCFYENQFQIDVSFGYIYTFRASLNDVWGNETTTEYQITATPNNVTNANYTRSSTSNSITVSWTKPQYNYDKVFVDYKKDSDSDWIEDKVGTVLNSKTFDGLDIATKYNFRFRVVYGEEENPSPVTLTAITRLNNVSGITNSIDTSVSSGRTINIGWSVTGLSSGIYVEYKKNTDSAYQVYSYGSVTDGYISSTTKSTKITLPDNGECYDIRLKNFYFDGSSNILSNSFCIYSGDIYTKPNPLASVTELSATTNSNSITLSWTPPASGNYSGVRIEYYNGSEYVLWDNVTSGNSKLIYNLEYNKYWYFRLCSYDAKGNKSDYKYVSTFINPIKVGSFTATTSGRNITLNWTKPSQSYYGVAIEYSTDGETYNPFNVYRTETSCLFSQNEDQKKYYFRATVIYQKYNKSTNSTSYVYCSSSYVIAGATAPVAPTLALSETYSSNSFTLNWKQPSSKSYTSEIKSYLVYVSKYSNFSSYAFSGSVASPNTSISVSGLEFGSKYYVKVGARDAYGNITYCSSVNTIILPARPKDVLLNITQSSNVDHCWSMDFTWTKPIDNSTRVHIYYSTSPENTFNADWEHRVTDVSQPVSVAKVKYTTSSSTTSYSMDIAKSHPAFYFKIVSSVYIDGKYYESPAVTAESFLMSAKFTDAAASMDSANKTCTISCTPPADTNRILVYPMHHNKNNIGDINLRPSGFSGITPGQKKTIPFEYSDDFVSSKWYVYPIAPGLYFKIPGTTSSFIYYRGVISITQC